jgi:hypothetical protein
MYNPELGIFIQRDPIKSDLNLYRYCGNNPVLLVDPMGTETKKITSNQDFSTLISTMYNDTNLGTMDDDKNCKFIKYKDLANYLRQNGATDNQINIIEQGCIGIAAAVSTNMNPPPEMISNKNIRCPEEHGLVYCFIGDKAENSARTKLCPKGWKKTAIFAKQGEWRGGKPPVTNEKEGPISSVFPTPIIGQGAEGNYNYVTVVGDYYVSATSAAAKGPDAVIKICKKPPLNHDLKATMWCMKCDKEK